MQQTDQAIARPFLREMLNDTMQMAHNAAILQKKAIEYLGRDSSATRLITDALLALQDAESKISFDLSSSQFINSLPFQVLEGVSADHGDHPDARRALIMPGEGVDQ